MRAGISVDHLKGSTREVQTGRSNGKAQTETQIKTCGSEQCGVGAFSGDKKHQPIRPGCVSIRVGGSSAADLFRMKMKGRTFSSSKSCKDAGRGPMDSVSKEKLKAMDKDYCDCGMPKHLTRSVATGLKKV